MGSLHIWGWIDFKEEINGIIIKYVNVVNSIISITYEVEKQIDKKNSRKIWTNCTENKIRFVMLFIKTTGGVNNSIYT